MHISALSNRFVKDPREVVKAGDVVKVKVLEVDLQRKRIALTMRMSDEPTRATDNAAQRRDSRPAQRSSRPDPRPAPAGSMADALARALKR